MGLPMIPLTAPPGMSSRDYTTLGATIPAMSVPFVSVTCTPDEKNIYAPPFGRSIINAQPPGVIGYLMCLLYIYIYICVGVGVCMCVCVHLNFYVNL